MNDEMNSCGPESSDTNNFHMSRHTEDESPINALSRWEVEERARTFIESGCPWQDYKQLSSLQGPGEYGRLVGAIFGASKQKAEENYGNEVVCRPELYQKKRRGDVFNSKSRHLTADDFANLYSAVAFANATGDLMDVHVTISWGLLGIDDPVAAEQALIYGFLKQLQVWVRYYSRKNRPLPYVYVHEFGGRHGLHTHLLTSIPPELRERFRVWTRKRLSAISGLESVDPQAFRVRAPASHRVMRQWIYLQYLCKGVLPFDELVTSDASFPKVLAIDLVRFAYRDPGQVPCSIKKFGISRDLALGARRRKGYKSALEQGTADIRAMYSDGEYLSHLKSSDESHDELRLNVIMENGEFITDPVEIAKRRQVKRRNDSIARNELVAYAKEQERLDLILEELSRTLLSLRHD